VEETCRKPVTNLKKRPIRINGTRLSIQSGSGSKSGFDIDSDRMLNLVPFRADALTAIAITHDLTGAIRNSRHFKLIAGLRCEDGSSVS
jgi:hypothetical protein